MRKIVANASSRRRAISSTVVAFGPLSRIANRSLPRTAGGLDEVVRDALRRRSRVPWITVKIECVIDGEVKFVTG